jgi:hypothetical protein
MLCMLCSRIYLLNRLLVLRSRLLFTTDLRQMCTNELRIYTELLLRYAISSHLRDSAFGSSSIPLDVSLQGWTPQGYEYVGLLS